MVAAASPPFLSKIPLLIIVQLLLFTVLLADDITNDIVDVVAEEGGINITTTEDGDLINDGSSNNTNTCYEVSDESAGCSDDTCTAIVCLDDPTCCSVGWGSNCVEVANSECVQNKNNTCFEPSLTSGCNDAECEEMVCASLPGCCDYAGDGNGVWDENCVAVAYEKSCIIDRFPPVIYARSSNTPCPLGYVCDTDDARMSKCDEIRDVAARTVGDVYAGIYCPEGVNTIQNCDIGSYCPSSTIVTTCPAGYFCPHKSSSGTLFPCKECNAGSTELALDGYGYYVLGFLYFIVAVLVIVTLVKRYNKKLFHQFLELQHRQADSIRMMARRKERQDRLERLRPKLELIAKRLERCIVEQQLRKTSVSTSGTPSSFFPPKDEASQPVLPEEIPGVAAGAGSGTALTTDSVGSVDGTRHKSAEILASMLKMVDGQKVMFRADKVFDIIDVDESSELSYSELNAVLELSPVELADFVRRMNDLGSGGTTSSLSSKTVSRKVFVKYFAQVLDETYRITCTESEAGIMFDELLELMPPRAQQRQYVTADKFYLSSMTDFLSDEQINHVIKLFRDMQQPVSSGRFGGLGGLDHVFSSRRGSTSPESTRPGTIMSIREPTTRDIFSGRFPISRDAFIANFPRYLIEVTVAENRQHHDDDDEDFNDDKDWGDGGSSRPAGVDITFKDLSLTVKVGDNSVDVVSKVTGRLKGKTMTALMGGSGAGKTSLLNALCGRAYYGETSGEIQMNGNFASIEEHADAVGFVPQDDIMYAELTVRENLVYSGKFRLPRGTPMHEIEELANTTMASLGLSRIAESPVGDVKRRGVSGGEKKRVNIGLELMARPSAIFLDEPTSGLDSSSALLVMKSLKNLVKSQGVTICSVIHQPRKFIFDLFDSLILLGVGGRMVYHGPTDEAISYFNSLGYSLPPGESVADWLIDISSGRSEADSPAPSSTGKTLGEGSSENSNPTAVNSHITSASDSHVVGARGVSSGRVEMALDDAKARREWLYQKWIDHYSTLADRSIYVAPMAYDLPKTVDKPSFFRQLNIQVARAVLVEWRNRFGKLVDTAFVVAAVVLISFFDGVTEVSKDSDPSISYEQMVRPDYANVESWISMAGQLFKYSVVKNLMEYSLKVGVIAAVLVGLSSCKIVTEKRVEFFREAGSGYNVNAYYLAINIVATIEHSLQIFIAAFFAQWLRASIASLFAFYYHFLALGWLVVSWVMLLAVIVPSENVVTVVGFFMAFCGLLFSGGLTPIVYRDMYDKGGVIEFFAGFVSPTRYFVEGIAVIEHRCMPVQAGFSVDNPAFGYVGQNVNISVGVDDVSTIIESFTSYNRDEYTAYAAAGYAMNDLNNVTKRSCDGWYWSLWPVIFVGLTVRFLGVAAIHIFGRSKQIKKPLLDEMKKSTITMTYVIGYTVFILCMFLFTAWLILRKVH